MRLIILALCAATLASTPAWATATLFCEASQKQFDFSIIAIVPSGQGRPLTQVRGEVTASPERLTPAPAAVELNEENNTQYWLDDDTLNLGFYTESETGTTFSSALLTIKTGTRADDDAYFDGKFHFESYQGVPGGADDPIEVTLDGKVTCSVG